MVFRLENLELMNDYGPEAWKSYNTTLVRLLSEAQKELAKLRHEIQEINFERKRKQTEAGQKLKVLETRYKSHYSVYLLLLLTAAEGLVVSAALLLLFL